MTYDAVQTAEGNEKLVPHDGRLNHMAFRLVQLRNLKKLAEEALDEASKEVTKLELELFDAMEAQGLRLIRTPDGTFSLNDLAWAKIDNEAEARAWAEANLPEAITLNHNRLSVIVRERIKAGEPLPPGITYSVSRKINVRKPE